MARLLVVDDDRDINESLQEALRMAGYQVTGVLTGADALAEVRRHCPDLVLLDQMLPDIDGSEVCRALRASPDTRRVPIMFLTARSGESERVRGLALGADDYVTKPFGMAELVARIRAVLRRAHEDFSPVEVMRVGDVVLDRGGHIVTINDRRVELTPTEFEILATLMGAPGQVFSRASLLEHLRGTMFENVERTVDVHIRNLRTKLEDNPADPQYIVTVFGVGYRFNNTDY